LCISCSGFTTKDEASLVAVINNQTRTIAKVVLATGEDIDSNSSVINHSLTHPIKIDKNTSISLVCDLNAPVGINASGTVHVIREMK